MPIGKIHPDDHDGALDYNMQSRSHHAYDLFDRHELVAIKSLITKRKDMCILHFYMNLRLGLLPT